MHQVPILSPASIFLLFAFVTRCASQLIYDEDWAVRNAKLAGMSYCSPASINSTDVGAYSIADFQPHDVWSNSSLQFFTGYDSLHDALVVSFRGTVDVQNWQSDLSVRLTYPFPSASSVGVHRGFYDEYVSMRLSVSASLLSASSSYGCSRVVSVGHSAGGAAASLLSFELSAGLLLPPLETTGQPPLELLGLYTFGSPRVGNQIFADKFREMGIAHARVTHYRDVIPHLPEQFLGYEHAVQEVYYNEDSTDYRLCDEEDGEDATCSNECGARCKSVEDHMRYINVDMGTLPCSEKTEWS